MRGLRSGGYTNTTSSGRRRSSLNAWPGPGSMESPEARVGWPCAISASRSCETGQANFPQPSSARAALVQIHNVRAQESVGRFFNPLLPGNPPRVGARSTTPSTVRIVCVRVEKPFAIDFVIRDRLLSIGRDKPIDELLSKLCLHIGAFLRVHQDHAVLVEHAIIPLHEDLK